MRALLASLMVTITFATLAANAGAEEASGGSPVANAQMVRGVLDAVFNHHDLTPLDHAMASSYVQHNPAVPQGRAGFEGYMMVTFKAVPDWHFELKKIVSDGDLVWTYGTYSGTQMGAWAGIPATGRTFAMDGMDIWRVENGQIVEHWDVLDINGLLKQLGVR